MAFTATQFLSKISNISTATTLATVGAYKPSASTAAQVYAFSVANVATSNKRAYVDVKYEDGAGNTAFFVRQMPIDPGSSKPVNAVSKHLITASGYLSAAITSTAAPVDIVVTFVEII